MTNPGDIQQFLHEGDYSYLSHLRLSRKLTRAAPVFQYGAARVALLSSFTVDPLSVCLEVQCASRGFGLECYQGAYGQYQQEILNSSSGLYSSDPELTFLWVDSRSLFPQLLEHPYQYSPEDRLRIIESAMEGYVGLIGRLRQEVGGVLVVANFTPPLFSEMGILENEEEDGIYDCLRLANSLLRKALQPLASSYILDLAHLANCVGLEQAIDEKLANYGDIRFGMDFIARVSHQLMAYLLPAKGVVKKCIVVDLDNTLWGGIVGEDGWEGVKVGNDTPEGRAFTQFQQTLLRFHQRGCLLAINSKNNEADALEVFRNRPEMILKEHHFSTHRINWQNKAQNLREIAAQLNIGLNSMLFLDDSPQERAIVRQYTPDVMVPEMPTVPDEYSNCLGRLVDLNTLSLTAEDMNKAQMYSQQASRENLQHSTTDLTSYLHSLQTEATIGRAEPRHFPRIAQLCQKTNQFNLTTQRYTETDIGRMAESDDSLVYSLSVADRFGDLGLVGVIIWKMRDDKRWLLDTLLLSCRCLGRHAEHAFLASTLDDLVEEGVSRVSLACIPTAKNQPVQNFVASLDWPVASSGEYEIELLESTLAIPPWINVSNDSVAYGAA